MGLTPRTSTSYHPSISFSNPYDMAHNLLIHSADYPCEWCVNDSHSMQFNIIPIMRTARGPSLSLSGKAFSIDWLGLGDWLYLSALHRLITHNTHTTPV
jgi:hypothetical protein